LYELRVRAAARAAHDLTDEEAEKSGPAASPGLRLVGVRGNHFIDDALELGGVADLPEPARVDDRSGIAALAHEYGEDLACCRAVDLVVFDQLQERGELRRIERDLVEWGVAGLARQLVHDPVRREACVRALLHGRGEQPLGGGCPGD